MTAPKSDYHFDPKPFLFDPHVNEVPSTEDSEWLAHETMKIYHFIAPRLGMDRGRFLLQFHNRQLVRVDLVHSLFQDARRRSEFDGAEAYGDFIKALDILEAANGSISAETAVWCIYKIFSVLYRLSDIHFGHADVNVRGDQLRMIESTKNILPGTPWAAEQLRSTAFMPVEDA